MCLLVAVEIGFRRGLGSETTRQIAHVVGAASVAVLPLFLRLSEMGALGLFFPVLLIWTPSRPVLHGSLDLDPLTPSSDERPRHPASHRRRPCLSDRAAACGSIRLDSPGC